MRKLDSDPIPVTLFDEFTESTFQKGNFILIDGIPWQKISSTQKITGGIRISFPLGKIEIPLPLPPQMHHFIKGILH